MRRRLALPVGRRGEAKLKVHSASLATDPRNPQRAFRLGTADRPTPRPAARSAAKQILGRVAGWVLHCPASAASSVTRTTSARAASAAPQGLDSGATRTSTVIATVLSRLATLRLARPRAQASLLPRRRTAVCCPPAPRPSGARPPRASSPRTSGSATVEYARSPYQTPHLAGVSAPGWSTFTGGSEHVGPHVFFYSTTPRLLQTGSTWRIWRGMSQTNLRGGPLTDEQPSGPRACGARSETQ